jgi:hypothetical protein
MKRLPYLLALVVVVLSSSCAQKVEVLFREPQPLGVADLANYPTAIRGLYIEDSTFQAIEVEAGRILTGYDVIKMTEANLKDSEDSLAYQIRDKTIYIKEDDKEYPYTRVGDTLLIDLGGPKEPLYELGPTCLLRKKGNSYFLNSYNATKGHWETTVVLASPSALKVWYPKPADFTGVPPEQRAIVMLRDSLGKESVLDYYLLSLPEAQFIKRVEAIQLRQPDAVYRRKSPAKSRR